MRLTRANRSTLGKRREPLVVPEIVMGIREEYITLAQLLKMAGVIGTGGEAKYYLAETPVMVYGEAEQRRGRTQRGSWLVEPGTS